MDTARELARYHSKTSRRKIKTILMHHTIAIIRFLLAIQDHSDFTLVTMKGEVRIV